MHQRLSSFLGVVGGRLVGRSGVVGLVLGLSLVPDIGNVARVGIGNIVGHNLGAAIGKSNTVLPVGGVVITVLVLGKVGARVVISHSIAILVDSRAIVGLSMSTMGRLVGRSRVVSRLGSVSRSSVNGVHGSMDGMDRSSMDGMHRSMDGMNSMGGSMDEGSMVDGSVVDGGMVDGSAMVSRNLDGGSSGMGGGSVLLLIVGLVDLVGLSRGLAHNLSMSRGMRAEDGGVDSGGIALLDSLVASLVGRGHSNEGGNGEEGLKEISQVIDKTQNLYAAQITWKKELFNSLGLSDLPSY